jgi:hypothetical protein
MGLDKNSYKSTDAVQQAQLKLPVKALQCLEVRHLACGCPQGKSSLTQTTFIEASSLIRGYVVSELQAPAATSGEQVRHPQSYAVAQ